jgi:hypothetical protein
MADSKPPLSHYKLREILSVYCICFEAAVNVCSFPSVTSFRPNGADERAWDMFLDHNTTSRGGDSRRHKRGTCCGVQEVELV